MKKCFLTSTTAGFQNMYSPVNLGLEFSCSLSLCVQVPSSLLPRPPLSQDRSGLLGEQEAEAFLEQHPVSGELVVWGEAGRVSRAGGLPVGIQLLSGVKGGKEKVQSSLLNKWNFLETIYSYNPNVSAHKLLKLVNYSCATSSQDPPTSCEQPDYTALIFNYLFMYRFLYLITYAFYFSYFLLIICPPMFILPQSLSFLVCVCRFTYFLLLCFQIIFD